MCESAPSKSSSPPSATTMYFMVNGTGVPMRKEEIASRAGKQANAAARKCEIKLVLIWTAEHLSVEGRSERDR